MKEKGKDDYICINDINFIGKKIRVYEENKNFSIIEITSFAHGFASIKYRASLAELGITYVNRPSFETTATDLVVVSQTSNWYDLTVTTAL